MNTIKFKLKEIDIILREHELSNTIVEDVFLLLTFLHDYEFVNKIEVGRLSGHNGEELHSRMAGIKIIKGENFGAGRAKEILRNLFLNKEKYLGIDKIDSDYFEGKVFDKICDLYLKYKDIL